MSVEEIVRLQKKAFRSGQTRSIESRKEILRSLDALVRENEKELCDAIRKDFGKPYVEAFPSEIYTVLHELDNHLKNVESWASPEQVGAPVLAFPSRNSVYHQPFGTVLIIGAWNYPVHLLLMPLIGAVSAGNTAVLKPSELAPETSSVIKKLFDERIDSDTIAVIEGAVEETTELLNQPFDKFFFTGSTRVGKIVMKAAAEQLIPVTLELGGKSPAIVHEDANLHVSARRIWWGKTMNAGQTCVAPDYVAVHESARDEFIENSKKVLGEFYRDDYRLEKNYTRIVNEDHFDRLYKLLEQSHVIFGGTAQRERRFIEPTIIEADWDDEIMQDEIFGPLLPVISYSDIETLFEKIADRPAPLALYLFTESSDLEKRVIEVVPFGGGCINDTVGHLANPNLPFGGVGQSGMGSYHGKHSFEAFSRKQAVMKKPAWPDPDLRYPPYDEREINWLKKLFT
ncbi:MAG: aldehyde dehydrogenase family protein [Bacteroidetes bacterium]|jgi:aldehyde dehydrogenase (NAD+)|nr:aldehyde dehydrogenase family protein [Bacteroidota bacterium]